MFTMENGLLTDTMKMKRKSFEKHFAKQIEAVYKNSN